MWERYFGEEMRGLTVFGGGAAGRVPGGIWKWVTARREMPHLRDCDRWGGDSEAEEEADHGFGGMGPAMGVAVDERGGVDEVGGLVNIAAILEAQSEVG